MTLWLYTVYFFASLLLPDCFCYNREKYLIATLDFITLTRKINIKFK
jgi:hypothetical protein